MMKASSIGTLVIAAGAAVVPVHHAAAQVVAGGIYHTPIGGAEFGPVAERRLPVRNLGSSGEDGVEVQLFTASGGQFAVDLMPLLGATGASREIRVRPRGWDGTVKGSVRLMSDPDGHVSEVYDYTGLGVVSVRYWFTNSAGDIVGSGEVPGEVLTIMLTPSSGSPPATTVNKQYRFSAAGSGSRTAAQGFVDITFEAMVPGSPPAADVAGIRVEPVPCAGCLNPYEDLGSAAITASGISEFVVSNASLLTLDLPAWGVGGAVIGEACPSTLGCTPGQQHLAVSNLGSSGQDGVSIDLTGGGGGGGGGAGGATFSVSGNCCRGHVIIMKLYDDANQEAARVSVVTDPTTGGTTATPDFSAIGATMFDHYSYDGAGNLLSVTRHPNGTGVFDVCPDTVSRALSRDDTGVLAMACTGGPDAGEDRFVPVDPVIPPPTLHRCELLSVGDPVDPAPLFVESVSVSPPAPACGTADFDGDGDAGTDADIEAFFACLGGDCCASCDVSDFDRDGDAGTDADIEAFFRVLGGGAC